MDFQPVKRFKNRGDVWVFRCVSDSARNGVLDVVKSIYLGFREVKVQRVTVVEFGMFNRSVDDVGWRAVYIMWLQRLQRPSHRSVAATNESCIHRVNETPLNVGFVWRSSTHFTAVDLIWTFTPFNCVAVERRTSLSAVAPICCWQICGVLELGLCGIIGLLYIALP